MPPAKKAATTAAKAEATNEPIVIEHAGLEFTIPGVKDMPLDVLEAETELEMAKAVLSEDWAAYKATKPTIGDFQELVDKINEAVAGQGN